MRKTADSLSNVDGGIHAVDVFLIQFFPELFNGLPEALEVNDLTLPEEADHIIDIGIITEPENVVIGDPRLLLWDIKIKETNQHRNFGNK